MDLMIYETLSGRWRVSTRIGGEVIGLAMSFDKRSDALRAALVWSRHREEREQRTQRPTLTDIEVDVVLEEV